MLVLLAAAASGCAPAVRERDVAAAAPRDPSVRITARDFGGTIAVGVGDVLVVERPANYDEWDLAFSAEVLRSLNTESGRRKPPAGGWTFAVTGAGTTDITLTPFVGRGGNVPRFVVTVTAR